jgi:hypothetical protein
VAVVFARPADLERLLAERAVVAWLHVNLIGSRGLWRAWYGD